MIAPCGLDCAQCDAYKLTQANDQAGREALAVRLAEAKLEEGTLVWKRAWDHHWGRTVSDAWGLA